MTFKISSPQFENNDSIPPKYTCDGDNINPPLKISGIPKGTISLVLIMDDPDVPRHLRADGVWDHWIVFNLPSNLNQIEEGIEPAGVHGIGTGGNLGYRGPCPPDKEHRYFFKLYALNTMLDLSEGVSKKEVEKAMDRHIIERTELIGKYKRG